MGFIEELIIWFIGLFVSDATVEKFALTAEKVMNYMFLGLVPIKYLVLILVLAGVVIIVLNMRYTPKKMLQKIAESTNSIYGAILFSYQESEDGKKYELKVNELSIDNLPSGYEEFGLTPEITIDTTTLMQLNSASEPYRVSRGMYNAFTLFGRLPYIKSVDSTALSNLISQWRSEFRTLSLAEVRTMQDEEKEKLSFKFMVLSTAMNVLTIGKDISLLRSNSFYKKKMEYNSVRNILVDENNDTDLRKKELKNIQKELTNINSMLARNIMLQDYFQAYSAATIEHSADFNQFGSDVTYMQLPIQISKDEKMMLVIILNSSFSRSPEKQEIYNNIRKIVKKHQTGIKIKNLFRKKK